MEQTKRPYEIISDMVQSLSDYMYGDIRISEKNYKRAFLKIRESLNLLNIDVISAMKTSDGNFEIHIYICGNFYRIFIITENWVEEIYREFVEMLSGDDLLFINTSESLEIAVLKLAKFKSAKELIFINIPNISSISSVSPNLTSRSKVFFKSLNKIVIGNAETKFIINYLTENNRFDLLLDIF